MEAIEYGGRCDVVMLLKLVGVIPNNVTIRQELIPFHPSLKTNFESLMVAIMNL
jgi:hypothetical protein